MTGDPASGVWRWDRRGYGYGEGAKRAGFSNGDGRGCEGVEEVQCTSSISRSREVEYGT